MDLFDWLRVTEILIAAAGIWVWLRWGKLRKRPKGMALGPVTVLGLLIIYNVIRTAGIEVELTHGSMSHAIRIMLLLLIAGGGLMMIWDN